jgi:Sec-independent protein translocase protein TatA
MELGIWEILFILILVVIFYGERVPVVAKEIGKTIANVKRNFEDAKQGLLDAAKTEDTGIKENPRKTAGSKEDFSHPYPDEKTLAG